MNLRVTHNEGLNDFLSRDSTSTLHLYGSMTLWLCDSRGSAALFFFGYLAVWLFFTLFHYFRFYGSLERLFVSSTNAGY